ncbi:MAG: transposase [Pseudomonadota bacterium]
MRARRNTTARRLMTVPGIGLLIAAAIEALAVEPVSLQSGRDFGAWIGLTSV